MGIILGGKTFAGVTDILVNISQLSATFNENLEAAKKEEGVLQKQIDELRYKIERDYLKAIYLDALKRGRSLDWANGKAEGCGLEPNVIDDDELAVICELFN
jgi:hypothetical protein